MATETPYGSWPSTITIDRLLHASVRIGEVRVGERSVFWSELRPQAGGRSVVVARSAGGEPVDVLPAGFSARTRAHEYGGGSWWLHDDALFFANWDDQRLYRCDLDEGAPPVALTPAPAASGADRYADGVVTPDHRWIVCVRERDEGGAAATRNELVGVAVEPSPDGPSADPAEPVVLVTGPDFVSTPRVSPDGRHLAWVQWNHPNMPWDSTELWVGDLEHTGPLEAAVPTVVDARRVAGGVDESIFQPEWDRHGALHFVSDRRDWWNLYRFRDAGPPTGPDSPVDAVVGVDGEIGAPQWVFGMCRYAFLGDDRVFCAVAQGGRDHLAVSDGSGGALLLDTPYTAVAQVQSFGEGAVIVAGSPHAEPAVIAVDIDAAGVTTFAPLAGAVDVGLSIDELSTPVAIEVPTSEGERVHALLYQPANPAVTPPADERPPLLVAIHGGPTSAARAQLDLRTQFWTSRGFAVVDVNYRGSTGYGRSYRHRLDGEWGVMDVEDCVAVARHLADSGLVDPDRMAIHGGSAGGFTTLAALEHHDLFGAGATFYGVVDLEALARDTHKFELRYLDRLVGPYPEARQRYVERSPLHHADRIDVPVLVLQGLEDRVVPPAQTEALVEALRSRGVAHAYLAFEGEQHGFRRAETIRRALEAELSFYGTVFGFEPADDLPPLELHGWRGEKRRS